ncbi:MAG TPA: FAD-binding oxidoreductase [Acidimicrobiales bacterium]|nr:FAD-binding oxidoreductase [Acidimicrobiales bacterium]
MPNEFPQELHAPAPNDGLRRALESLHLNFSLDARARADHARDWWPLSIPLTRRGDVRAWPGAVVHATSTDDVTATLALAQRLGRSVTVQGGRSGVLGGATALEGGIALDLTAMNQVLEIDEVAGTVRVQAGCFGPDLERALGKVGLTVGHFPQSFELATVGGWLACRGAGQYSNRYGKIEDLVRGLRVVLADGTDVSLGGRGPRAATGPDLVQLFVGSEGTLGVITEATLLARRRAPNERRAAYAFTSMYDGLEACRRILQRDAHPAVLRLYDAVESRRHFEDERCVLIVLDEGDPLFVDATMSIVAHECRDATALAPALVEHWLEHRNDVGALAPLWEQGMVVDTIEVAAAWTVLSALCDRVLATLRAMPDMLVASVHQSHAYLDGACLYFTFAGRPASDVEAFYRGAWDATIRAVLEHGGTLSHHHGVGRNRARFMPDALGSAFPLLVTLKTMLDPHDVLNPGVLGLGGEAW